MIKNLAAIESAIGLSAGDFDKLYKDPAEKEIDMSGIFIGKKDEYEVIPKADYTTRITNIKQEGITQGFTQGEEVTKKALKKAFGIDVAGAKKMEPDEFAAAAREKIIKDANLPPDEKIRQFEIDKAELVKRAEKAEQRATGLESDYKKKEKQQKISNVIFGALPKDLIIERDEAAELTIKRAKAAGISFDIDDTTGAVVFKKGDEVMKDANRNYEKPDVVLKDYFAPYVKQTSGGGGGGDDPGKRKSSTMEAFMKEMADAGKNSIESSAEMARRMKENPNYFK